MSQKKVVQLKWLAFITYIEYEITETTQVPFGLDFGRGSHLSPASSYIFVDTHPDFILGSSNWPENEDTKR